MVIMQGLQTALWWWTRCLLNDWLLRPGPAPPYPPHAFRFRRLSLFSRPLSGSSECGMACPVRRLLTGK